MSITIENKEENPTQIIPFSANGQNYRSSLYIYCLILNIHEKQAKSTVGG